MKKKLMSLGLFMMIAFYSFSQFELKIDPINAIFGQIPVSAEFVASKNIGIEATGAYNFAKDKNYNTKSTGLVTCGLIKFYFSPKNGGDRFYAFPYVRYVSRKFDFTNTTGIGAGTISATYKAFGAGFGIGYKIVAESGLLFDIGFGVGKNFSGKYTYNDPTYSEAGNFTIPINAIGRMSIGYRFGGSK
jgi:hypothetical protein